MNAEYYYDCANNNVVRIGENGVPIRLLPDNTTAETGLTADFWREKTIVNKYPITAGQYYLWLGFGTIPTAKTQ